MTYRYITDAGHGWLEVPHFMIEKLGIRDKVSSYSFYNANNIYLEEDCDAGVFIKAHKKAMGKNPEYKETYQDNCFVRDLPNIRKGN